MNVIVKKRKKMKTKKSKMIKAVAGILTGPITYKMAKKKKMKMEDIAPFFGAAGLAYSKMKKRKGTELPLNWAEHHKKLPPPVALPLNGPFCGLNDPVRKCPFHLSKTRP